VSVGLGHKAYKPRVPVLFYPPEGFAMVVLPETFDSSGASRCMHCERAFRSKDAGGTPVFTMCCSLRCYRKLRGIRDPSAASRDGANLKRKNPKNRSRQPAQETHKLGLFADSK